MVAAKPEVFDSVVEMGHLLPFAARVPQVVSEVAAIAIGHGGDNPLAILTRFQRDLGDARKFFAHFVFVLGGRSAEPVKPYLLIEVDVRFRSFPRMGIARGKNGRALSVPG